LINASLEEDDLPTICSPLSTTEDLTPTAVARLLQKALVLSDLPYTTIQVQVDGGANRSITNNRSYLLNFRNIKKYPMNGVNAEGPALMCTGIGYLPWKADTAEVVLVKTYYSTDAAETLISPTDIVVNNYTDLNAWTQYSNLDTNKGYVQFYR